MMKEQLCSRVIGVLINVIDARSIERAGAPDDSVDFVPFRKQKFSKVRAVLARDSGDECAFHVLGPLRFSQNDSKTPRTLRIIYFHQQTAGADKSWPTQRVLLSTDDLEQTPGHPWQARWWLRVNDNTEDLAQHGGFHVRQIHRPRKSSVRWART